MSDCAEEGFVASAWSAEHGAMGKAKCVDGGDTGKWDIDLECKPMPGCEAKGGDGPSGWTCKGDPGGRGKISHGAACEVQCNEEKLTPQPPTLNCDNGAYKEGEAICSDMPPEEHAAEAGETGTGAAADEEFGGGK